MKKIIFLLCAVLCLAGCGNNAENTGNTISDTSTVTEVTQSPEASPSASPSASPEVAPTTSPTVVPTPTPLPPRTVDISGGISSDRLSFSNKFDFDLDGIKEEIRMKATFNPDGDFEDNKLMLTIGNYSKDFECYDMGSIDAVYACDIDRNDGLYDIAIITCEGSGDPRIRILKYNPNFSPYQFKFYEDGETFIEDDNWFGYAVNYYFNVNNDGTITLEEQTPSYGMWSVYVTYKRNSSGVFEEIKPKHYDILSDFMKKNIDYNSDLTGEEKAKWEKGYVLAHTDYNKDGVIIKAGEYFKPLYDDGNNHICVEKENGEVLWLDIRNNLEGFNHHFFFLAG